MRPIAPASRLRIGVVAPPSSKNFQGPRAVLAKAEVDNSWTKPKMLRLRKAELVEACRKNGLEGSGNKEKLANTLYAHLHSTEEINAVGINASESSTSRLHDSLTDIDAVIQAHTSTKHHLHEEDRAVVSKIVSDMKGLKESWNEQLKVFTAGLDEVVALKKNQEELYKLHSEQGELQQDLEVLSRMLKQREVEIQSLQAQLKQMRKERANEKANEKTERLAVLALASQVSMGESSAPLPGPVSNLQAIYAAPSYSPLPKNSTGEDVMQIPHQGDLPQMFAAVHRPEFSRPSEDVLGIAMPGLLFCGALLKAYGKFAYFRDLLCEKDQERAFTNAVASGILVASVVSSLI